MNDIHRKMRTELTNLDNLKEWPACEACFYLAKALNLIRCLQLDDLKGVLFIGGAFHTDIPDDQRRSLNTTVGVECVGLSLEWCCRQVRVRGWQQDQGSP